jgi:hypothetical protein
MKPDRAVLAGIVLPGSISGCGDYATKTELEQLRAQYVATHDTMVALWEATDSIVDLLSLIALDTVPRPKCIPRCMEMPTAPPRMAP